MKWALFISIAIHALIWCAKNNPDALVWRSDPVVVSLSRTKAVSTLSRQDGQPSSPRGGPRGEATGERGVSLADAIAWGNIPPVYPEEAQRAGWEGEVLLRLVCEEGRVKSATVEKSSGYSALDESARSAALQWKFPPDRVGNEARIPIQFKLD